MALPSNPPSMTKWIGVGVLVILVSFQFFGKSVEGKSLQLPLQQIQAGSPDEKQGTGGLNSEMEVGDDENGGMEANLLNYLYTKQMLQRLRQQLDLADPVKKRNYWKQCAFNAVSCFG